MMKIKLLMVLLAMLLNSGCAFTVHDLPINYEYSGDAVIAEGEDLPQINIAKIEDSRSVENPRMIMNQKNGYGQTMSGGWQAEKDLALIVEDALTQGVAAAKLNSTRDRIITIDGELVDVSSSIVSGWWTGTIGVKISVKLSARNAGTNEIIWRDTIYGEGIREDQASITPGLAEALKIALDNMIKNLLSDDFFQQNVLK